MKIIVTLCFSFVTAVASAQTIQERLGYPADTKLLIIHGDDIGMSHSVNEASFKAIEKGIVNSGSILVPCPWLPEVGAYAKSHPAADLGLHLALNAEWRDFRWGGVTDKATAPSLVDAKGFLYDNSEEVVKKASLADVEKELRAQVERARQFGIDPTHFDSHMGTLFMSPEFLKAYIRLGHEYKVPVMLHDQFARPLLGAEYNTLITKNDVVVDMVYLAQPEDYKSGFKKFYTEIINGMKPGLNVLIIHLAFDDSEMRAVTIDHADWGAAWRQADYDFFTSDECRKLLSDNKIKLITWREVRDKIVRK